VLVRSDSAGGSTRLAWHLRERGVGFTLGMQVDAHVREAILVQPEHAWTPAVESDGQVRDGAEVCELTGWVDLRNWPDRTRVLCRREDAHPGAQLRFTDHDGHRFQVLVTDQADSDLAALELRHRQRARVEDRIRAAKATGLRNLPFDLLRRNAVWLELVLAAQDLTCWTQTLLLDGALALAEPKALRYRLLHVAARGGSPRPPHDPTAAALLAMGPCPGACVRPAAHPPAALLIRSKRPTATTTTDPGDAGDLACPANTGLRSQQPTGTST
jgi:Transposase DDE domain group 1